MIALLAALSIFLSQHSYGAGQLLPPVKCGDFLNEIQLSRPDIEYIKCKQENLGNPSGKGLLATYAIRGADIFKVERWLNKLAHTGSLRRSCCVWETKLGQFRGRDGAWYEARLSTESTEYRRRDLKRIPIFYLEIGHDIQDP
jgi:hypothetical protein